MSKKRQNTSGEDDDTSGKRQRVSSDNDDGMRCWVVDPVGEEHLLVVGVDDTVEEVVDKVGRVVGGWGKLKHEVYYDGIQLDEADAGLVADTGVMEDGKFLVRFTDRYLARDRLRHSYKVLPNTDALKAAVRRGDMDLIKCLITAGIDPLGAPTRRSSTPDEEDESSTHSVATSELSLASGVTVATDSSASDGSDDSDDEEDEDEEDDEAGGSGLSGSSGFIKHSNAFVTAAAQGRKDVLKYFVESLGLAPSKATIKDALVASALKRHSDVMLYLVNLASLETIFEVCSRARLELAAVNDNRVEVLRVFVESDPHMTEANYARMLTVALTRCCTESAMYLLGLPFSLTLEGLSAPSLTRSLPVLRCLPSRPHHTPPRPHPQARHHLRHPWVLVSIPIMACPVPSRPRHHPGPHRPRPQPPRQRPRNRKEHPRYVHPREPRSLLRQPRRGQRAAAVNHRAPTRMTYLPSSPPA
eukprot:TRINITY_DN30240_c0_g1_i1.p1 TRINITY_DN30240_c0_g1~~TRINITY_DN30240_c0_g1_i1.p1  ORF type:complete len:483 (+),score=4.08 TRINITY_DN30240_c0_g1_i1:36-1451(+)